MDASVASKYANLPDIDTEQPDVYETPDVPEEESFDDEAEVPLSEDISTDTVPTGEAAARFRVSSGDIDPKSALARYQRSLLRTLQLESLSGDKEVYSGSGTSSVQLSETPEQRLRRLVYEAQELRGQLETSAGGKETKQSVSLMKLVSGLHDELAQLSLQTEKGNSESAQLLWKQLDEPSTSKDQDKPVARTEPTNVSAFEQRIATLEKLIGANSTLMTEDSFVGHNLVETVARLRQQIEILADPQRVEGIQRRVKQMLVEMDRLELANMQANKAATEASEGKGTNATVRLDPGTIKRVDELYEKMSNIDSLIELAPATARRLQSLSKLHAEAAEAVSRISRMENEQGSISEELATMKEVAASLKSSIAENSETLKANVGHIDSRIAALNERLDGLKK
ncbi:Dynamitin-domain-containing protein [Coemansia mojavensis]|nr:Dynamitin-domain-containing protein [Coemansia mojavensis]